MFQNFKDSLSRQLLKQSIEEVLVNFSNEGGNQWFKSGYITLKNSSHLLDASLLSAGKTC